MSIVTLKAGAAYGQSGQYIARIIGRDSSRTFKREFVGRKTDQRSSQAEIDEVGLYEVCDIDKKGRKEQSYTLVVDVDGLGELDEFGSDREDAMAIAKAMDEGREFSQIVHCWYADDEAAELAAQRKTIKTAFRGYGDDVGTYLIKTAAGPWDAGTKVPAAEFEAAKDAEVAKLDARIAELEAQGRPAKHGYEILSKAAAKKQDASHTLAAAIDDCWKILQAMDERTAKKVLTELRKRVSPKAAAEPEAPAAE
jgi:hypothetical protein